MLTLADASYRYPGASTDSLRSVSLELAAGTITGLVGPTEAGKSTLCLVASGLAPRVVKGRLSGDMRIDGVDVGGWPMHRLSKRVVIGLQDPEGQLSMVADSVRDEVAFGPANAGLPRDEVLAKTDAALDTVGIEDLAGRDPRHLSGGQQQLVVLAGLLAMQPAHLILDEPVAHLDSGGRRAVLDAVGRIAASGTAVLIAEQRTDALASICDSVAVMVAGNIVNYGPFREIMADVTTAAHGVEELPDLRLRRRLIEAGLDPDLAQVRR